MSKRGQNEGSIYRRKDGRWAGAVSLGYVGGRLKRKTVYGATRKEVQHRMTALLSDRQKGLPVVGEKQRLDEFLTDWLENWVRPSVKPNTFSSYADTVRLHLLPTLGRVPLAKLTPQHVQAMLKARLASGLSPRTVAYLRSVLGIALARALKLGLVQRNVVQLVDRPNVARHEIRPLTVEQSRSLLASAADHRLGALFSVALALGLRKGEALGLRWQEVDLDGGTLVISGALQRIGGALVRAETKNNSSRRMLHVPAAALRALREHRVRQMEERLAAGEKWQDSGLVFTTTLGTPLDPRNVLRHFARVLKAAGIPHVRFHDLRHSCATLLLAQGVPARVVQDILGHSAIRVTMDVYSHVMPSMRDDAVRAMDSALGR
jgi:integrase